MIYMVSIYIQDFIYLLSLVTMFRNLIHFVLKQSTQVFHIITTTFHYLRPTLVMLSPT